MCPDYGAIFFFFFQITSALNLKIYISIKWKMAGIGNTYLMKIMGKLQPLEVEHLKYILEDTFTGKIYSGKKIFPAKYFMVVFLEFE